MKSLNFVSTEPKRVPRKLLQTPAAIAARKRYKRMSNSQKKSRAEYMRKWYKENKVKRSKYMKNLHAHRKRKGLTTPSQKLRKETSSLKRIGRKARKSALKAKKRVKRRTS